MRSRLRARMILRAGWREYQRTRALADGPLSWFDGSDDPAFYSQGHGTYGTPLVHVFRGDTNRADVGRYCSIASEVEFFVGGNHRVDWPTTFPLREILEKPGSYASGSPCSGGDIRIGSDVWFGRGSVVLSGVTIGSGAVIGTRAVVGSNVRPYAVMVGNPAREAHRRFGDDVVEDLLGIRWWDWPRHVVEQNWEFFCQDDMGTFLSVARTIAQQIERRP